MHRLGLPLVALLACAESKPAAPPPDPPPTRPAVCGDEPFVGPVFLRRLTREQYVNTVRDLLDQPVATGLALPDDERIGAFFANAVAPVTGLAVESYQESAERIASDADLSTLVSCDVGAGDDGCARRFIADFGTRTVRRPLDAVEESALFSVFEAGRDTGSFEDGIRLVITGLLQSASFLYRPELGVPSMEAGDAVELTSFELASRLSYFLWNTMPDQRLFELAQADALRDQTVLEDEARRMLDDPRSEDAIGSFHLQWLGVSELDRTEKDAALFPYFTAPMREAMKADVAAFANHVIRDDDARLDTLLTAPYAFPTGPLSALYGVAEGAPAVLDPSRRAGILTMAGVLAVHAHPEQTSPVRRGLFVRSNLLCQNLPPAPPDVDNVPPDPDPNSTVRERLDEHRTEPRCAGCHNLMDPIGFGFEHYDATGVFRETEAGRSIDATGEIFATPDIAGTFDGAVELAARLADSEDVRACVPTQWLRFMLGRVETEDDACSLEVLRTGFAEADLDLREVILGVVATDAFRYQHVSAAGE